ncbi:MAG: hypothetical protein JW995_08205 [Melioribacteraceae bacterium]|nr:hypothetical protein [Melioribacteraceae bacterium]
MADRITNLQPPPPHWNEDKIEKYKAEAELILEQLKDGSGYLACRLAQIISEY